MNGELRRLVPLLRTLDLAETIRFYTTELEFELCAVYPEIDPTWCLLGSGSVGLMFSTGDHLGPEPALSGTLYVYPDDVTALYESLKDRVPIAWPLQIMDHGTREFAIEDCNGYLLAFAEDA